MPVSDRTIEILLGDEAVALAAIHAGIGGAFSYPGTPATEIFEFIEQRTAGAGNVSARWSVNEKVAYEEALGMSYAGRRALVSMKHVGLNVAADPFMSSSLTGVNGGLVLAVADDPGMHSSQNEQDSRFFGDFARIPVFEPANQQECYDMTVAAFELSEQARLPVMLRLVTRLAHSRANIYVSAENAAPRPTAPMPHPDWRDWTLLPPNARRRFTRLIELQPTLTAYSERSPFNMLTLRGPRGIVASGVAYNYVREILGDKPADSIAKIGTYPLPEEHLRRLVGHCSEIIVIEEGYPLIERALSGLLGIPGKAVFGRMHGGLPPCGELTPDIVASALGCRPTEAARAAAASAPRPPQLCTGCPHADTFHALTAATAEYGTASLFSDIGCYSLGALSPFNAVHTCVDMGASIAMAHGASQAGAFPVLCTIGDSTFAHSGMTALLGAARHNADMTVVILDNATVAMTGTQESYASGERLLEILHGLGVPRDHLHVIEPLPKNHAANVELLAREIRHRGLSVIVARRACLRIRRSTRAGTAGRAGAPIEQLS